MSNQPKTVNVTDTMMTALTTAEREIIFQHITNHPEIYKKLLGHAGIIDNLINPPSGLNHQLISHYKTWKNK